MMKKLFVGFPVFFILIEIFTPFFFFFLVLFCWTFELDLDVFFIYVLII